MGATAKVKVGRPKMPEGEAYSIRKLFYVNADMERRLQGARNYYAREFGSPVSEAQAVRLLSRAGMDALELKIGVDLATGLPLEAPAKRGARGTRGERGARG